MQVTISIPEAVFSDSNEDVSRRVLEQVAIDGFKSGQLSTAQIRRILGFETRMQVHEFLATHGLAWVDYDSIELERETETLKKLEQFAGECTANC